MVGSFLTAKNQTRLKRLAGGKHSSLFRILIIYGHKKFFNIWPMSRFHKIHFLHNLQMGA
jgi:hypothetical protein